MVKLQSGDKESLAMWKILIAISVQAFEGVYGRLGVTFSPNPEDPSSTLCGESFKQGIRTQRELAQISL